MKLSLLLPLLFVISPRPLDGGIGGRSGLILALPHVLPLLLLVPALVSDDKNA